MSCSNVTRPVSQPSSCRKPPVPSGAATWQRLSLESSFTSGTSRSRVLACTQFRSARPGLGPTLEVGRSHHPRREVQEPRGADLSLTQKRGSAGQSSAETAGLSAKADLGLRAPRLWMSEQDLPAWRKASSEQFGVCLSRTRTQGEPEQPSP